MGSQVSQCFLAGAHLVLDTQGVFTFLLLFFFPSLVNHLPFVLTSNTQPKAAGELVC